MSKKRPGGCLCGAVRYELPESAGFQIQCFCRDCQHISGGGHLPQEIVDLDKVAISGEPSTHEWISDSGNTLKLGFCGACGSPIFKTTTMAAGKIAILVGSLDDPTGFTIQKQVFEARRLPWDRSA